MTESNKWQYSKSERFRLGSCRINNRKKPANNWQDFSMVQVLEDLIRHPSALRLGYPQEMHQSQKIRIVRRPLFLLQFRAL